jgi:DGQHR domain-containing protein
MIVDAFKVVQKGGPHHHEIYVTTLKAIDVVERCSIDRWTKTNYNGYQRLPNSSRLHDSQGGIVRYLIKDLACFPTSILINIRDPVSFEKTTESDHYELGKLDLGDTRFWLIDGQHRVEALKCACSRSIEFEKYPIVVSFLVMPERFNELLLFYVVNRKQKSVPTDLAYRNLQRMLWEKGSKWLYEFEGAKGVRLGIASEVVDQLNADVSSPWYRRIRMVGDEDKGQIIEDGFFISVIARILNNKVFTGMPVRDFTLNLVNYWNCIKEIYPEAFKDAEDYTLLSRAGIYVFTMLFPMFVVNLQKIKTNKMNELLATLEGLKRVTPSHTSQEFIKPIDVECWSKKSASAVFLGKTRRELDILLSGIQEKIIASRSPEVKSLQQKLVL